MHAGNDVVVGTGTGEVNGKRVATLAGAEVGREEDRPEAEGVSDRGSGFGVSNTG